MQLNITQEEINLFKELFSTMKKEGMNQQVHDYKELLNYMSDLQNHVKVLSEELNQLRTSYVDGKRLESKDQRQYRKLSDKIDIKSFTNKMSGKINGLSKYLADVKDMYVITAKKALISFREQGKESMNKVLLDGSQKIQTKLMQYKDIVIDILQDYKKQEKHIAHIDEELKETKKHLKNAARLIVGKKPREVGEETKGSAYIAFISIPLKNSIRLVECHLNGIEQKIAKLEEFCKSLSQNKEVKQEVDDKSSVMEKLEKNKMNLQSDTKETPELVKKIPELNEER